MAGKRSPKQPPGKPASAAEVVEPKPGNGTNRADVPPTPYAAVVRRFANLLAEHEQSIAAGIEREVFAGRSPSRVNTESLVRGMVAWLDRSTDALIEADMAYHDILRQNGRLAPDAPSISPRVALRVGRAADLARVVGLSPLHATARMDGWVYPGGVPEVATVGDWLAGLRGFADSLARYLERGADQEPFVAIHHLTPIIKAFTALIDRPDLTAAFEALDAEVATLPPPSAGTPRN